MNSVFYLFILHGEKPVATFELDKLSWVYKDVNNELKLAHGSLSDVPLAAKDYLVTVVLPGEDILCLKAEIPGTNAQRIRQAVPFALEDSVIDDVDDLHFAIKKTTDNNYDVAVIKKDYLESVVSQLKSAGVTAEVITADYLLLTDNNTLFCDGQRVMFNSDALKFSSGIDNAAALVTIKPDKIIQCGEQAGDFLSQYNESENIKKEACDSSALICFVKNSTIANSINLLQGDYKKTKKWSDAGKRWLPVAAVMLVWLSLQGGLFIVDYINFSSKNQSLKTDIDAIYKKTFPESKRIVNAKVQMQQQLAELQKKNGQSGRSFAKMMSDSAAVFTKTKGLKIKSLRYYDGRINLELELASLQALESLKSKLNKENGYKVEVQNASSEKNAVTARLQITGVAL
jgi:general secretion pathway protein L